MKWIAKEGVFSTGQSSQARYMPLRHVHVHTDAHSHVVDIVCGARVEL